MLIPSPELAALLAQSDLWEKDPFLVEIESVIVAHLRGIRGNSARGHWVNLRNSLVERVVDGKTSFPDAAQEMMVLLHLAHQGLIDTSLTKPTSLDEPEWKVWFQNLLGLILTEEARIKKEEAAELVKAADGILAAIPLEWTVPGSAVL